jgi:hypothetical protein
VTEQQLQEWFESVSSEDGDLLEIRLLSSDGDWYRLLNPRLVAVKTEDGPGFSVEFDEPEPLL